MPGFTFLFFLSFFFFCVCFICSGFCHTLKWNSHGFTCVPHPDPPSHLTIVRSLFKLMPIESMTPSNHLILCHPLLLPSILPSIRIFSSESALHIRWYVAKPTGRFAFTQLHFIFQIWINANSIKICISGSSEMPSLNSILGLHHFLFCTLWSLVPKMHSILLFLLETVWITLQDPCLDETFLTFPCCRAK